ncbi:MAG TPA: DUF1223 domain-containing protein [Blastocatellia bacterium]|nr:DUF1223 domain-containing protein [Blastocatellia bacterium]
MFKSLVTTLALTAVVGLVHTPLPPMLNENDEKADVSRIPARSPVLVELFTSEGCSSCPLADELLSRLEQTQPVEGAEIIALSEHVDYWNRLGWVDPFSSSEFSSRQSDYGSVFGLDDIYTPQMIVDGRIQFVGSNASKANDAISNAARESKADITIAPAKTTARASGEVALDIRVASLPSITTGDTADVLLAITESGLRSNVSRGENAGRELTHTAVVRSLSNVGVTDPGSDSRSIKATAKIEKGWTRSRLKAVVFVQERRSRRVLGAASISLAPSE